MTTLNARANQAWHESGEGWLYSEKERECFEEGWETGYKAALDEPHSPTIQEVERVAHALYADTEVGEWEDGRLSTLLLYRRAAQVALEAYTGRISRETGGAQ